MNDSQKTINILIGAILAGVIWYFCWKLPEAMSGDISLAEASAKNANLSSQVWLWRVGSTIACLWLFGWVVRKNTKE